MIIGFITYMVHYYYIVKRNDKGLIKENYCFLFFSGKNKIMAKITCLRELEEREELQLDDIVIFIVGSKKIQYSVDTFFLTNLSKTSPSILNNDEIFKILKINKNKMAEKIYGHNRNKEQSIGLWPNSNHHDFSALTRLVAELYKIIEERKPVFTKFTRFEIMEI